MSRSFTFVLIVAAIAAGRVVGQPDTGGRGDQLRHDLSSSAIASSTVFRILGKATRYMAMNRLASSEPRMSASGPCQRMSGAYTWSKVSRFPRLRSSSQARRAQSLYSSVSPDYPTCS